MGRVSTFRSDADREAYGRFYDEAVALAPLAVAESDVPTSWGSTHVLIAGDPSKPPLVALHAKSFSATMWLPLLPTLTANHRVHLVDVVGDLGKSTGTRVLSSPAKVVAWIDETLDALEVDRATFVGASIGSWMTVHYACVHPQRVLRMALLCPAGIVSAIGLRVMLHLIRTGLRPRPDALAALVDWMAMPGTRPLLREDPWRPVVQQFVTGMCGFRARVAEPKPAVCRPLDRLGASPTPIPTLVVIGADEVLHVGPQLAERFRARLPHARVELLEGANHLLFIDQPETVAALLDEFLA